MNQEQIAAHYFALPAHRRAKIAEAFARLFDRLAREEAESVTRDCAAYSAPTGAKAQLEKIPSCPAHNILGGQPGAG